MAKGKRVQLESRAGVIGKKCMGCGEWKELEGFNTQKKGVGMRRSQCKPCEAIRRRIYRERNIEKALERSRDWRANNRDKVISYRQKYHNENYEEIAERLRKWRIENPEKKALIKKRRWVRKSLLPNNFTEEQKASTFEFFNGKCALTGSENIQWDHVIPIATGHVGTTATNMIPLSPEINASKHASNIFEWFKFNKQRFKLPQEKFDILIEWLSSANDMSVEEYREYVYWCHDNPRVIEIDVTDNDKEVS